MAADKRATASDVLARMRLGNLPVSVGAGGHTAVFSDGLKAGHQTMRKLVQAGKIVPPQGGSIDCPWTLTDDGKDASKPMDEWRRLPVVERFAYFNQNEDTARREAQVRAQFWNNLRPVGDHQARWFKRNVKAGGCGLSVFVVIVRRQKEGVL